MARIASVVGLGVIGASLALALKRAGWEVYGSDFDPEHARKALDQSVIYGLADPVHPDSEIVFIATPPGAIADAAKMALKLTERCPVTDVGSVKQRIAEECDDPRFVPGHPMTGSERSRLEGASASLFEGATWVLTPNTSTDEGAFAKVAKVVQSLHAELRLMDASQHDKMVAAISHVPNLLATTLLNSAFDMSEGHEVVLARLAAGSFRDMTRVASGDADIWLDICHENRYAIKNVIDDVVTRLVNLRGLIDQADMTMFDSVLREQFVQAKTTRDQLPTSRTKLAELIVGPVEPSKLKAVLEIATQLDVSVKDFYVEEDSDGKASNVHLSIPSTQLDLLRGGLSIQGFKARIPRTLHN